MKKNFRKYSLVRTGYIKGRTIYGTLLNKKVNTESVSIVRKKKRFGIFSKQNGGGRVEY